MKSKKGILVGAIATIALCVSIVAGATFALFTSETGTNVVVKAGTVNVTATIKDVVATHGEWNEEEGAYIKTAGLLAGENAAALDEKKQTLTLTNIAPTDKVTFKIAVQNDSNVPIKYRTIVACTKDDGLAGGLSVTLDEQKFTTSAIGEWTQLAANGEIADVNVAVELPFDADNKYQNKSCTLSYKVEAVQANGKTNNGVTITGGSMTLNNDITVGVADDPTSVPVAVKASGEGTNVTIVGGNYDGGSGANNQSVRVTDGATVTIKGGNFTVGQDAKGYCNALVETAGGNLIVEGGFFETEYYTEITRNGEKMKWYYLLNQNNGNPGTITVKGGTFVNYNPEWGDDNLKGNFVADGYEVITETKENGDIWYTVKPIE